MLNAIPVVGWLLDFIFKVSLALPFWLIWTVGGLGRKYFYFLPEVYQSPPFWNCVGLFIAVPILYLIFVPKIVSVSSSSKTGTDKKKDEKKDPDKDPSFH